MGIALTCVLAALLWAARAHRESIDSLPAELAREFRPLLAGENVRAVNIGAVERKVDELRGANPYIEEIVIRKVTPSGGAVTVYPVFFDLDHPDFASAVGGFRYKAVVDDSGRRHVGDLYLKIDEGRRRLYMSAIIGSIVAICVLSILGALALQTKEEEVRKTSNLLEEKQKELIHLERLAMAGQIAANLLHDLKKPVLNIRAEIPSIRDEEARQIIQEETDLFLGLIRDLQLEGFLRKSSGNAEFLDVAEIIERSLRLVKYARERVNVELDLPEYLPFIFGRRNQMIQVVSNLLVNAFQALEGEGTIRVSASRMEIGGEPWLEIAMTDDGPGMPYEILSNIFKPFFTTRPDSDSTGLGLYITKTIVENMGGRIDAHSIPKHGTTFTVQFPISEAEIPEEPSAPAAGTNETREPANREGR